MKCSYFGTVGTVAAVGWFFTITIKGGMDMDAAHKVQINAQGPLNAANAAWNAANSAYNDAHGRVTYAEDTISNANCFIQHYPDFFNNLNNFCSPAARTNDSLNVLRQNFGIQLETIANEVDHSTGTSSFEDSYKVRNGDDCDIDSNGKKTNCKPHYDTKYKTIYYNFPQTLYTYHGARLSGPGSQIGMSCGRFSQGFAATASQSSTDTGWTIDGYRYDWTYGRNLISSKSRTIRYYSKIDVNINVDSTATTTANSYDLDPNTANLASVANTVLPIIFNQCNLLKRSLRKPADYKAIADSTTSTLAGLREDESNKLAELNAATTVKNQKQAIFNSADAEYQKQLSIWLPQLFVALPIFIYLLFLIEETCAQTDANPCLWDTEDPFKCCYANFKRKNVVRATTSAPTRMTSSATTTLPTNVSTPSAPPLPTTPMFDVEIQSNPTFVPNASVIANPSARTIANAQEAKEVNESGATLTIV